MSGAPHPVTFRGSGLARALLRAIGWKIRFQGLPARQGVVIAYPHTSNWDFPVAILTKWATGLPVSFLGKDSLFRVPLFGRWLRWVGGIPVDRSGAHGFVETLTRRLHEARDRDEMLWFGISPEGTRAYREHWRTGFYHLAMAARVPLMVATLDWGRREIRADQFLTLSGDADQDMQRIAALLDGVRGRRPEKASPVKFAPP